MDKNQSAKKSGYSESIPCGTCKKTAEFVPPPKEDKQRRILVVSYRCPDGHITTKDVLLK